MKPYGQMLRLRRVMRLAALLVPVSRREAWRAEWLAELNSLRVNPSDDAHQFAYGLIADAFALRWISVVNYWRTIDRRSPANCLRMLFSIFTLLSAVVMSQPPLRHLIFSRWGPMTFTVFLILAVFTVPSAVVISRFTECDPYEGDAASTRRRIARWVFLGCKLLFVVLSSYLLAVGLFRPLYEWVGLLANFLLMVSGTLFNIVGMGWAFDDQRERCPTCMRLLHSPACMGQPSWSLLSSNATEEMCDKGHGLLHQPQWQTSWFSNARWLQLDPTWRGLFRP